MGDLVTLFRLWLGLRVDRLTLQINLCQLTSISSSQSMVFTTKWTNSLTGSSVFSTSPSNQADWKAVIFSTLCQNNLHFYTRQQTPAVRTPDGCQARWWSSQELHQWVELSRATSSDGVSVNQTTSAAQQSLCPPLPADDEFGDKSLRRQPEHHPNSWAPMGQPTIAHLSEVVSWTGDECDVTIPQTSIGSHLGMGVWEGVLGSLYTTNIWKLV